MAFMSKNNSRPEDRPLLRELIDIPESVSTSDFVLKLNEAVTPEGAKLRSRTTSSPTGCSVISTRPSI